MIWLTRLDGAPILLNEDQIVLADGLHDTIVTLATGDKLRVQESAREIARRVADWRRETSAVEWLAPERTDGD